MKIWRTEMEWQSGEEGRDVTLEKKSQIQRQTSMFQKEKSYRSVMIHTVDHKHKSEERETPTINNAEKQIDIIYLE